MLSNLLDIVPNENGNFYFDNYGEPFLYALIGFVVVFVGICILILIIYLVGLLMRKTNNLAVITEHKARSAARKAEKANRENQEKQAKEAREAKEAASAAAAAAAASGAAGTVGAAGTAGTAGTAAAGALADSSGTGSSSDALIPGEDEGISPETVAIIMAALMAYYDKQEKKCEFVVRRIKRL